MAVVCRGVIDRVFRLIDRVGDESDRMFVGETVEHALRLIPSAHDAGHTQLSEVLRHRRGRPIDDIGQAIHGQLVVTQSEDDPHPCSVSKHPEYFNSEVHVRIRRINLHIRICVHA